MRRTMPPVIYVLGFSWRKRALVRPLSWVIYGRGIYYDASGPSDLEYLLQTEAHAFDAPTLQRASALRQKLVSIGLTKYNVGAKLWSRPAQANDLQVVCHGLPFYAGWGLTQDTLPAQRRSRKLDIDQLVAGVLLAYPTYVSRLTGKVCEAEQALAELLSRRSASHGDLPFWRKMLRPLLKHQ